MPKYPGQKPHTVNEGAVVPTVYLTNEQLQRLAAISLDSLVGVQIHTDAADNSYATFETVKIDEPNDMDYGVVYTDGSYILS